MYIPPYYKEEDREKIFRHLRSNPFGIVASCNKGRVEATHLPFIIEQDGEALSFISHYSKANPQWKIARDEEVLVIFTGPDAYISPSNYEKRESVPTWNYTTVHVRGKLRIIEDLQQTVDILEKTIVRFELPYMDQWKELSQEYKNKMIAGLVAFDLTEISIEAKFKLSQNKTDKEINSIINDLEVRNEGRSREVSEVMKNYYSG